MTVKPNFLIPGAARSGTTSLYDQLRQHPEIFMPENKEPAHFVHGGAMPGDEEYYKLFEPGRGKKAIGEATVMYLYAQESAEWIKRELGPVKHIIMLRNPADRAFSLYLLHVREGLEDAPTFEEALRREPARIAREESLPPNLKLGFRYFSSAIYHEQIERYWRVFGPENVKIILAEEFYREPLKYGREVFEFLGVDPSFQPKLRVMNEGLAPRSVAVQHWLHRVFERRYALLPGALHTAKRKAVRKFMRLNMRLGSKPQIDPGLRRALLDKHAENIQKLERLLQRDLSIWYKPKPPSEGNSAS